MLAKFRSLSALAGAGLFLVALSSLGSACEERSVPASSYYDERIGPVLEFGCVEQTAGCHLASERGEATGNLDLSSYDSLMRRRDVLPAYGPYSTGLLLLKGSEDIDLAIETMDPPDPANPDQYFATITTDIRHNAGGTISIESGSYGLLKQWIESGFLRTGAPDEALSENEGDCVHGIGESEFFDPAADPVDPASFERFRNEINPLLRETCSGRSCHGSSIAELYLTCGDDDTELRWNYFVSVAHLSDPVSTSPFLRRPLSQLRGGVFHEGGHVFASAEDPTYQALRSWAEELVERTPSAIRYPATVEEGFRFFVNRVQPILVRKGCFFMNCHGPAMFHDLRLRGGSQGQFSRIASLRNYEMSRNLLGIESPDVNNSRLVGKNIYLARDVSGGQGILHRGGSLFEDFPAAAGATELNRADATDCVGADPVNGDLNVVEEYCVMLEWHRIEREAAIARGELMVDPIESVVYVARPTGVGDLRDFETYRGGAELMIADATLDPTTTDLSFTGDRPLNAMCGITGDADIRQPAVSWDGTRIAFAARVGAGSNWAVYEMNADGSGCAVADVGDTANHNLDPAYAPDGRLIFASTRGNIMGSFPYDGPTLTPAALQPNANLYVRDTPGAIRQLTFLLNQELAPAFMGDGRLIMTAEKREREFHQLAGRRLNLDGGDYHPLFAQRDSVGFNAAWDVVELINRNLVMVAGPIGAEGGAIAVVNRSIGPDQTDRPADDRAYFSSMDILTGVYRNTSPLPNGRMLAACDQTAMDPSAGNFPFQICEIDGSSGAVRALGGMGAASVDPVAVFARAQNGVFVSRIDEANGHTEIIPGEDTAEILIHDFPVLATLVFSNTRVGRNLNPDIDGIDIFEAMPPPPGTTDFNMPDDGFGPRWEQLEQRGSVGLRADGSVKFRISGGMPMLLRPTVGGSPLMFGPDDAFTGEIIQREQMQFYPGEHTNQSFQRVFFNGLCGGCHGSLSGRELDIAVNVDILSAASQSLARDDSPADLVR